MKQQSNTNTDTQVEDDAEKISVPKWLQNELHEKIEPYIERIIEAYKKEGIGFSRFSLNNIALHAAVQGYYHAIPNPPENKEEVQPPIPNPDWDLYPGNEAGTFDNLDKEVDELEKQLWNEPTGAPPPADKEEDNVGEWTKGEWYVEEGFFIRCGNVPVLNTGIANFLTYEENKANAQRIVQAVNGYDKLKAEKHELNVKIQDLECSVHAKTKFIELVIYGKKKVEADNEVLKGLLGDLYNYCVKAGLITKDLKIN